MPFHLCPICGASHAVSPVRARFAYGRQLACSGDCEAERRKRRRDRYWHLPGPLPGNDPSARIASASSVSGLMRAA
jgi:hypothetical protein